jgi:hypothetical protein
MPTTVAVGDLDRDGKPDLVTPNVSGNSVSVLINIYQARSLHLPIVAK